jgi:hypothetical protein
MDNYTPIIRKKCVCRYCKADTCSKCIERYLLERHEDAHCLHCRVNYNDAALQEICTKTYIQHVYFKHRQEVLINRERANLPGLQDVAIEERRKRDGDKKIQELKAQIAVIENHRDVVMTNYNVLYTDYYSKLAAKQNTAELRRQLDEILKESDKFRKQITDIQHQINLIRWPVDVLAARGLTVEQAQKAKEDEKKKFIRRCTRDGCQGFLSTAWKCGICEYYSCNKCFKTKTQKHDDPHECTKEDLETAKLIMADCKPCPNCGEFIMKSSGCDQMWCISCQTPFSWTTGKVVTGGIIHNPHYYEWMKRNGNAAPRNPADIPCGGYPNGWELRRMPKGLSNKVSNIFFEFHRICQELQDISTRSYRSHIDLDTTNKINVKFLLGDYDEKHWGQNLGKNERKRKLDGEIQEIFAAYRMVAVELINRVQNYRSEDGKIRTFTDLPLKEAEKFLEELAVEINALIKMINDALRNVSISYCRAVPYIALDGAYYSIKTKNFSDEVKKKRGSNVSNKKGEDDDDSVSTASTPVTTKGKPKVAPETPKPVPASLPPVTTSEVKAIEQATQSLNDATKALKENKINTAEAFNKATEAVKADNEAITPVPAPAIVDVAVETINAVTDAVKAVTETIKIKRKKPAVAPKTEEENLADELGEDAALQAAIAASLSK